MTGFAAARRETGEGELTVSLRSVNHRGLDLHFHGGSEFTVFENEMRSLLKRHIARGHVEVRLGLNRVQREMPTQLNRAVLDRYLEAFRETAREHKLDSRPDLNVLLAMRGVMNESSSPNALPAVFLPEALAALENCVAALNSFREREGDQLRLEMMQHAEEIESSTAEIAGVRADALPYFNARLREKLSDLLAGAPISESRLVEEAAILADRSDIQEEIVRLGLHVRELRKTLAEGGEVGKRLDFLLQEMNRETNTTLAKSTNAGEPGLLITNLALAVKANIERIREQALNLE